MENPYARAASPTPATPEQQKLADYELAIGENAGYYMARFSRYDDGGSKIGWNWPAFFVTTPWFLYRKMWGWGLGNVAYFWVMLTFVAPITLAIAAGSAVSGNAGGAMTVVGIILGVLIGVPWILLPMYANALYWRHINRVIRNVPATFQGQPDKRMARISRNGGTGVGVMIAVLVGGAFLFLVIIGILAAIAIPAYQDYTIRAQITEGLNLAVAPKAAVAEYYARNNAWPENSEAAGVQPMSGKYVESLNIEQGSIVVIYGAAANKNIAGKTLVVAPGLTEQREVVWACANRAAPEVVERGPGPHGTDLPNKYLPVLCRPAAGT